jgi:hypothetical protein
MVKDNVVASAGPMRLPRALRDSPRLRHSDIVSLCAAVGAKDGGVVPWLATLPPKKV